MILNPLDWTAGPFLTFYIVLAVAVGIVAATLRNSIGGARDDGRSLTPLELAYLAEGPKRLGDAVLVGLLTAGAATLSPDGKSIDVKPDAKVPPELDFISRLPVSGSMTRRAFQDKIASHVDTVRRDLRRIGLVPSDQQISEYRFRAFILMAAPILTGAAKVAVGMARDKPVGFLIMLLIATVIVGVKLLKAPLRTAAGAKALTRHRAVHAREARAPLENEFVLAVALGGLIVLSGTPHDALYAASQEGGWSGSADVGGGDGGGSGCGGCGGCGGGG